MGNPSENSRSWCPGPAAEPSSAALPSALRSQPVLRSSEATEGGGFGGAALAREETEIIIRPDGWVIVADLSVGLLPLALELNPEDPRIQELTRTFPPLADRND